MSIKSLTAAILIGVVTLTGCTSMSEYRERLKQYDDSQSYAMNVTRQFWEPKFSDTPVPKGVYVTNSTINRDVTLSTLAWATGPSSVLPGGFGLALGMDLMKNLGKETPLEMQPHVLMFVDAARFPVRKDAELEAVSQVYSAVRKALAEEKLAVSKPVAPHHMKILWKDIAYAGAVFENEKLGCLARSSVGKDEKKLCYVDIMFEEQDDGDYPATKVPSWMNPNGILGWPVFAKASVTWNLPDTAKITAQKLFETTAKHLPDGVWFYMQPRKEQGEKKYSAPYLLDNKGAHFFVIEEEAEKTAKR